MVNVGSMGSFRGKMLAAGLVPAPEAGTSIAIGCGKPKHCRRWVVGQVHYTTCKMHKPRRAGSITKALVSMVFLRGPSCPSWLTILETDPLRGGELSDLLFFAHFAGFFATLR